MTNVPERCYRATAQCCCAIAPRDFPAISSNTPAIALARRAKPIAPLTHQTQLIAKVGSRSRKVGLL